MPHIVCFHLYNDYSGSPKVLKGILEGLSAKGYEIDLITSYHGVLDELAKNPLVHIHHFHYRFSRHALVTVLRFFLAQMYMFFKAFRWWPDKGTVFYINTILPIGPALAGWLMQKKIVYHYHENAFAKGGFYKFGAWVMQKVATRIICVSAYQAGYLKRKAGVVTIPNGISSNFISKIHPDAEEAFERKTVLMLSSLKGYKGTRQFIELSRRMPQFKFTLVINDDKTNIDRYIESNHLGSITKGGNLRIFPRQNDVTPFYNSSSIVVNFSDKKKIIETFGLTAIEAMTAGLPVIVPTVGGIAELVEDGVNGFKTDVDDMDKIERQLNSMLTDLPTYMRMSAAALKHAEKFKEENTVNAVASVIG